jgi:arylamine N-acetyltransferase
MSKWNIPLQSGSAYSTEQIATWLEYINFPTSLAAIPKTIETLNHLHQHSIAAFSYENLLLHYSPIRKVPLEPQALYDKMITAGRGRGGFCFEVNLLYHEMLKGLGFDVYLTGVKIRPRVNGVPSGEWSG